MGRSILRSALAAQKGVDFKKLKEKKRFKLAVRQKAKNAKKTGGILKSEAEDEDEGEDWEDEEEEEEDEDDDEAEESNEDDEDDEDEEEEDVINMGAIDESDESDSEVEMEAKIERPKSKIVLQAERRRRGEKVEKDDEEKEEEEENDDEDDEEMVAWSDLDEEERAGLAVRRRQTINNKAALTAALNRIRIPKEGVPFYTHMTVVPLSEPTADSIEDVQDDVARELQLYRQSLEAVVQAREWLLAEGVPFTRPADYFAEMVKDDEHMQQVRERLVAEASAKKASAEARRQRELKKFGKQVQVAKMQERHKAKKDTLEKIQSLKRKRQETGATNTHEADLFDVGVENELGAPGRGRAPGGRQNSRTPGTGPNAKRVKKNEKYGFGGKKRNAKSGDAMSSGDLSGFNAQRMKKGGGSSGGKFKAQRPGKARRKAAVGRK